MRATTEVARERNTSSLDAVRGHAGDRTRVLVVAVAAVLRQRIDRDRQHHRARWTVAIALPRQCLAGDARQHLRDRTRTEERGEATAVVGDQDDRALEARGERGDQRGCFAAISDHARCDLDDEHVGIEQPDLGADEARRIDVDRFARAGRQVFVIWRPRHRYRVAVGFVRRNRHH